METYRKGVLSGLYEAYFPDGTPRLSFNYLDGEKHGKYSLLRWSIKRAADL